MEQTQETTRDFDAALARYLSDAQALTDAEMARYYPSNARKVLSAMPGKRYVRIVVEDGVSRFAHSFIDRTDGSILKPDGWKRPAKHARGNIYTYGKVSEAISANGAHYIVRGRS